LIDEECRILVHTRTSSAHNLVPKVDVGGSIPCGYSSGRILLPSYARFRRELLKGLKDIRMSKGEVGVRISICVTAGDPDIKLCG
jgi:hypothetical protein